jgi:4-hydroxy 2-oxovalerate aldolase
MNKNVTHPMSFSSILDCTLRDGAYLTNYHFGEATIRHIIERLTQANIDVIECGFLQNQPFIQGKTLFNQARQVRPYLPLDHQTSQYVLLADLSRYDIHQLDPYDGHSIHGIRACFFKHEAHLIEAFARVILDQGYQLYIQPVDILAYQPDELKRLLDTVNRLDADVFSIVDTFGAMQLVELQSLFHIIDQHLHAHIAVGFHSHNNQQLSFGLTQFLHLLCAQRRHLIIDSTLYGMGRGAGNTPTELVAAFLNQHGEHLYDIPALLHLIDTHILPLRAHTSWGYALEHFVAGVHATHVNTIQYLQQQHQLSPATLYQLLPTLDVHARKTYQYTAMSDTVARFTLQGAKTL